jgi:hypothetical protein
MIIIISNFTIYIQPSMHQRWVPVSNYYLLVGNMFFILIFTQEAEKTSILWNVWVLLTMLAIWMSRWVPKKRGFSLFHRINSSQSYNFIFICYSFLCVADWVTVFHTFSTRWKKVAQRKHLKDYINTMEERVGYLGCFEVHSPEICFFHWLSLILGTDWCAAAAVKR